MDAMAGKRVLITGATSGIGLAAATALGQRGAELLLVARDRQRGEAARDQLLAAGAPAVRLFLADLSLLSAVRELGAEVGAAVDRIDVLLNNAGAIFTTRQETAEGFERTFALNHLSYFLLTHLLLPRLAPNARVINVSSHAHRGGRVRFDDLQLTHHYSAFAAYNASKLENLLFTFALARRLHGPTVNALHPGVVRSGFGRHERGWVGGLFRLGGPLFRSPEEGARTSVWLASSPAVEGVTGKYFADCRQSRPSRAARDEAAQERLWRVTAELVGVAAD